MDVLDWDVTVKNKSLRMDDTETSFFACTFSKQMFMSVGVKLVKQVASKDKLNKKIWGNVNASNFKVSWGRDPTCAIVPTNFNKALDAVTINPAFVDIDTYHSFVNDGGHGGHDGRDGHGAHGDTKKRMPSRSECNSLDRVDNGSHPEDRRGHRSGSLSDDDTPNIHPDENDMVVSQLQTFAEKAAKWECRLL
ncbi:hypothetical protein N0V93_010346 [Gnomoniopsis smithogilvyi]|uniref:Uncharacterized protein n=1 Tax=Gnomoniopsis smithogilvyi TaxID=1191159 RepID=A0A9W8YIG1_9PEZI|nr:hypothetical protein N0V93_010346 [Gnomoniopsis smithogilvyi]